MTTARSTSRTAKAHRRPRRRPITVAKYLALSAGAFGLFIVPVWVVIVGSWKPFGEAIEFSLALPRQWALVENYGEVIEKARFLTAFLNSLLVTSVSVVVLLLVGSMAAWGFGRSRSRIMAILYYVAIIGILLPPAIVPTVFLMRTLHIDGSYVALILYTVGVRMAVVIFLMTGFVRALPREIEEAAEVDGATPLQTYRHVVLPLLRPIFLTAFVILVISIWNDFLGPFFLLHGPERWTLPLSLYNLSNSASSGRQIPWNLVFAQLVLVSGPLLIVYFAAQRHIVAGLTGGSLKG